MARHFVRPGLGLNCLQKLSSKDTQADYELTLVMLSKNYISNFDI